MRVAPTLILLLWVLFAATAAQAAQRIQREGEPHITDVGLPATHSIYDPYLPIQQFVARVQGHVIAAREPEMTLTLPKRRYVIGEPIWATLTIRNVDEKRPLRLSPPYVGQHVATLGIWRARWEWLRGGQFTGPLEVVQLNKGRSICPPNAASFGGVPIELAPGEMYTATIPLNVAQQVHPVLQEIGRSQLAWYAGAGLTEPGLYQLYVQYANLQQLVPFGRDPNQQLLLEEVRELGPGEPVDLPFQAIVPAPVEVEIVPPQMKAWDPLQQQVDLGRYLRLLRDWEAAALYSDGCLVYTPSFDELPAVLDSLHESEVAVRQSLLLTKLRFDLGELDPQHPRYRVNIERLLGMARGYRESTEPGPLADAHDLTICHLLRALGREQEATELARKLKNPDAAAFVAEAARQ